jgi:hypothetical protein
MNDLVSNAKNCRFDLNTTCRMFSGGVEDVHHNIYLTRGKQRHEGQPYGLDCISALKDYTACAWQLGPFGKQGMHLFIRASSQIFTAVGKFFKRRFSG